MCLWRFSGQNNRYRRHPPKEPGTNRLTRADGAKSTEEQATIWQVAIMFRLSTEDTQFQATQAHLALAVLMVGWLRLMQLETWSGT